MGKKKKRQQFPGFFLQRVGGRHRSTYYVLPNKWADAAVSLLVPEVGQSGEGAGSSGSITCNLSIVRIQFSMLHLYGAIDA